MPLYISQHGRNSECPQNQMLVRMWSNMNSLSLQVGMENGTVTLEYSLAVSYKTKHGLTMWSGHCIPWCLPKCAENVCPPQNLHVYICSNFTHHCQNLEETKMSFNRWMDKLWNTLTKEYHSTVGSNEPSDHEKIWRNLPCILPSEKN